MTSRETILTALRAAGAPTAPPATPVRPTPGDGPALERFLATLKSVGGNGVVRRSGQPLDALIDSLVGIARDDMMVIPGRFAVAENGAVYVDAADLDARNDVVRAQHLVVVVPQGAIVETMHDAVRRIPPDSRCGWFLSGPSKTADIEQALVVGAQGSRTHHVIFDGE